MLGSLFVTLLACLSTSCSLSDPPSIATVSLAQPQDLAPPRSRHVVNINTATVAELEQLPGITTGLAERIIAFREKNGSFRRSEHLLLVRGFTEKHFQQIKDSITVQ